MLETASPAKDDPFYLLFCECSEGEKSANMSWANWWDWESKHPLAVTLNVTRAGAKPPGVCFQKGTKKILLFHSP